MTKLEQGDLAGDEGLADESHESDVAEDDY